MIDFLISFNKENQSIEFISKPSDITEINLDNYILRLWGDPINYENIKLLTKTPEKEILEKIDGHYYYLLYDKISNNYFIGNSVFSILPVYYMHFEQTIYFSNNPLSINDKINSATISKRFILENILFNYPVTNHSCFEGIKLMPTNNCFRLSKNNCEVKEIVSIENYFVSDPMPWKQSSESISDLFLERVKYYLPEEKYLASLTGGLDGRTLVASSLFYKKKFNVYSFGNEKSRDVNIPKKLAAIAHLDYRHINLDEQYIKQASFNCGKAFIVNSNGTAGFSRAHYLYAADQLKNESKYLVTGNFGSELFRAAHIPGVLISPNLYRLFSAANYEEGIRAVEKSEEWNAINKKEFEKEWADLKVDLKELPCFCAKHKLLTKNKQFYIFLFNEIIRKYFGAEIVNQYNRIINRTPFLDFTFVKELLKTELSGVYSDFFTHNPLKRFKGQVAYAHIIRKAFPLFGQELTDKGHRPEDLLSVAGKAQLLASFIKKKFCKSKIRNDDDFSVDAAFENNIQNFSDEIKPHYFFKTEFIQNGLKKKYRNRDIFFIALSQLWWLNYLEKKYDIKN